MKSNLFEHKIRTNLTLRKDVREMMDNKVEKLNKKGRKVSRSNYVEQLVIEDNKK